MSCLCSTWSLRWVRYHQRKLLRKWWTLYISKLWNEPGQYFMFRWGKFELGGSLNSMHTNGSNVPFDVGKRTFIKLFAFAFISAIFAISLLEFRPALISFRVQPTCAPFIAGNTSLTLQFNKNTVTYKYSA